MKKIIVIAFLSLFFTDLYAQEATNFITVGTDSIFYRMKGNGTPVLFLSGGPGGSPESLQPIVDHVSLQYKTVLMHQRGTGLSANNKIDPQSMNINQYTSDIDQILDKENLKETYIVGHSWGAMLALDYMVKNPSRVRGLVLIGAPGYSLQFTQSMNNEIFSRMTASEMDSLQLYFKQLGSVQDGALKEEFQSKIGEMTLSKQFYNPSLLPEIMKYGSINMKINGLIMGDLKKRNWDLGNDLKELTNPVVVINGEYDPIKKEFVLALKDVIKNTEIHFLKECGHYVWIEQPKEVLEIMDDFLSKH